MYGLIYDIIAIAIDEPSWVECAKNLSLLIIRTIFRPLQSSILLKRDDLLSLSKLAAEGQLYKRKTCLGWDTQTRSPWVLLPREKETSWVQYIR